MRTIGALDPHDLRSIRILVAGPGALLVSKAFKLAERAEDRSHARLADKDAFDAYRLLQLPTREVVRGIRRMLHDDRTRPTAEAGIEHIRRLFASADAVGARMAGRSVERVGEPETVRLGTAALAEELLKTLTSDAQS